MIELVTSKETKRFNLKNFDRERKLYSAWYAMKNDPQYKEKAFNITTTEKENLHLKISEIIDCKFDECQHVKGEVEDCYQKSKVH